MKTRFAPSPTGHLHLGHAFAAWTAHDAAHAAGGAFVLRVEDIDQARCRPAFEAAILEDLAWLGLRWEQPVRRQSQHFGEYAAALDRLAAMGLLYPCFCTRGDIAAEVARAVNAPHGPEGPLYPGTCRRLSDEERRRRRQEQAYALRLDVTAALAMTGDDLYFDEEGDVAGLPGRCRARPQLLGDVVLARKDLPASYHLAVVMDDAAQGIALVTRGADLSHATHIHRLLQALLDLPAPRYAHHRLILDEHGRKFSKRDDAVTLRALRTAGVTAADLRRRLRLAV